LCLRGVFQGELYLLSLPYLHCIYSHQPHNNVHFTAIKQAFSELQTTWHILRHFKSFDLSVVCNNGHSKCSHFINIVTLAYIIRKSLRTMCEYRNL
jgi:hypothetical protein